MKLNYIAIYSKDILITTSIEEAFENGRLINVEFRLKREAIEFLKKSRQEEPLINFCYPQIYNKRTGKYQHVDPSKLM